MRRNNKKKGFTIVELVIVIAVIAILAAVMIPTFSGIVKTAQESAALQKANAAYKNAYAEVIADGKIDTDEDYTENGLTFTFNGTIDSYTVAVTGTVDGYNVTVTGGVVKVEKPTPTPAG